MGRAITGGQTGVNGDFYFGGEFLPNTSRPKGSAKKAAEDKKAAARLKAAEFNRKSAAALLAYESDPRLQATGHYRETEAAFLAQQDGVWASL